MISSVIIRMIFPFPLQIQLVGLYFLDNNIIVMFLNIYIISLSEILK